MSPASDDRKTVGVPGSSGKILAPMVVVVLLVLGLPAVVSAFVSAKATAEQVEHHWHYVARCGAGAAVAVFIVLEIVVGDPWAFTYSGYGVWLDSPSLSFTAIVEACLPALSLTVPIGVTLGACLVGISEHQWRGAEWHPLEARRNEVERKAQLKRVAVAIADQAAQSRCPAPPIGAAMEGDLQQWRHGAFAVVAREAANRGVMIAGAAGSGKTESALRFVRDAGRAGRKVVFLDCKGTDPDLAARVVAAWMDGSADPNPSVHVFPDEALNGWIGTDGDIANRLAHTQEFTDFYYGAATETVIRLVTGARLTGEGPITSSTDFLRRCDLGYLARAYRGTVKAPLVAALQKDPKVLAGVMYRMHALFGAVDGALDGQRSYGDADVVFIRVNSLAAPVDAEGIARFVLADLTNYISDAKRKPRVGRDLSVFVDEASAITGLVPMYLDIAERGRDAGVAVYPSGQSWQGFGRDDDERRRVRGAMAGGVLLHRCDDPEEFCRPAGTKRVGERSFQLEDDTSASGMGSMRMAHQMLVNPDEVRRGDVGEAWMISGGRFLHMQVIPNSVGHLRDAKRLVVKSASRGQRFAESAADRDCTAPETAAEQTGFPAWDGLDD